MQLRSGPFTNLTPVVKNLLIINGLMYLATLALRQSQHIELTDKLGLYYFTSSHFNPIQLLTHMFMHGSFMHLFSNMFSLFMFGAMLENYWGSKRFLIFYILCGFGGALLHLLVNGISIHHLQSLVDLYNAAPAYNAFINLFNEHASLLYDKEFVGRLHKFAEHWQNSNSAGEKEFLTQSTYYAQELVMQKANIAAVGASGAVFGILAGFGLLFPNTELLMIFFPIPIKAKYFVLFYAGFELYAGFTGTQDGVAHFAHIGGALVGVILVKLWQRNRKFFY